MDYKEFTRQAVTEIQERMGETVEIRLTEVVKNNNITLTGIMIVKKNSNVSPTIYLESFYEKHRRGESIKQIAKEIVALYEKQVGPVQMDMDFFTSYEMVRNNICHKLVHYEMNKEQLKQLPHIRWNDLAVIFYYDLGESMIGKATITIRNEHMEMWGISTEELYRTAQQNMKRKRPELLIPIKDMLEEIMKKHLSEEYRVPLYVLTNKDKMYGASALLYSGQLKILAEKLQSDLLILPSSVHEVLLLEDDREQDYAFYREMVREVNGSQVEPDEVLSENIYRYDRVKESIEEI